MGKEKSSSGGRILNTVLFLGNLAMIIWIVFSWREQNKPQPAVDNYTSPGYDVSVSENTGSASSDPDSSSSGGTSDPFGSSSGFSSGSSSGTSQSTDNADSWLFDGEPASSGNTQTTGNADSWLFDGEPASSDDTQPAQTAQTGEQTAASYSTTDRPEASDFQTWYEHYISGGIPSDAHIITDYDKIKGSWKGLLRYSGSTVTSELMNFTVSGDASSSVFTVDWYLVLYTGDEEWMNEEDMEDLSYAGSWSDGVLAVNGAGDITIRTFYEIGGQQFAVGEMAVPDGSTAVVGMVRP